MNYCITVTVTVEPLFLDSLNCGLQYSLHECAWSQMLAFIKSCTIVCYESSIVNTEIWVSP